MAARKIYQAFGMELTVEQAAKAAGVSKAAFYNQLSKLGGAPKLCSECTMSATAM